MGKNVVDPRLESLLEWIPVPVTEWVPLAGDASRRRYFRIRTPECHFIGMDAPPPEQPQRFVDVARLLARAGVRVPVIHAFEPEQGFVLLEDFGDETYLDALHQNSSDRLYDDALRRLLHIQTGVDPASCTLPHYTAGLLQQELDIFREWLLERWLKIQIPLALWKEVAACLVNSALEQPQVLVHRDYHSRNLMVLGENNPGVLDFQDAVIGPITYDPVSLLKDCYIAWPADRVGAWGEAYRRKLEEEGLPIRPRSWQRWFDRMGVQRHLKAAGIFVRLWLRDGRRGYLADIPRTLSYIMAVCDEDKPLQPLFSFMKKQVLPELERRL